MPATASTEVEDFRPLFDLLPEATLLVGMDGRIVAANRSAARFLGAAPGALSGRNFAAFLSDGGDSIPSRLTAFAQNPGLSAGTLVLTVAGAPLACRTEGALFSAATQGAGTIVLLRLFVSEAGNAAAPARPVDELRREVSRLTLSEQALLEADQRKNEFLAVLAHELRNPLAPLRNGVELLEATTTENGIVPGPGARTVVGMLKRQVGQLARLVDDLLDVTRITHGRLRIELRPLSLLKVLERAIETVGPVILDKQQRFVKTLPPLSVIVDADLARLLQVFVNLLSNTSRFTLTGGSISLATEMRDGEVVVRIRGDGDGVPPELMPSPSGKFHSAGNTPVPPLPGGGIGLAVAHSLVAQHNGEMQLVSADSGSELVVRLPARIESSAEPEETDTRAPVAAAGSAPVCRKKVLIVDDNVDAAQSLEMLLSIANHEVRLAHDPEQALETLDGFAPDVILLDIGLPGMDGFQLAKVIRSRPGTEGIVLAALTGYGKEQDRLLSAQAGFDAHFTKPVAYETLDWLLNPGSRPLH